MEKQYITLEEAKAKGYKMFCGDGSEHCEELADIDDYKDDYTEIELMELEPRTLILSAETIIENECENQEIWDCGDQIPDAAIAEFQKACEVFNAVVYDATRSYTGSGFYIKLKDN